MRAIVLVRASARPTIDGSPSSYGGNCVRGVRGRSQRSVRVAIRSPPWVASFRLESIRKSSDRVQRRCFEREGVEIDRIAAAKCCEADLLDPADNQRRDHARVDLAAQIAGRPRTLDVALDDADQRFVDLVEELLDLDIEADGFAQQDAQRVAVI